MKRTEYKVWDGHKKRMLDVVGLDLNIDWRQDVDSIKNVSAYGDGYEDILNFTVIQYINHKDDDGNKIFEDDLVRFDAVDIFFPHGLLGRVIYREDHAAFMIEFEYDGDTYARFFKELWGVKVVGNKYEGEK